MFYGSVWFFFFGLFIPVALSLVPQFHIFWELNIMIRLQFGMFCAVAATTGFLGFFIRSLEV